MSRTKKLSATMAGGCLLLFLIGACSVAERVDKSRIRAQEMAALNRLRTLQAAEVQYSSMYGEFAKNLSELGPSTNGTPSAKAADLIPTDLASGVKDGYRFTVEADFLRFSVEARPVEYGKSGIRSFFSDPALIIHENSSDAPATAASPALN